MAFEDKKGSNGIKTRNIKNVSANIIQILEDKLVVILTESMAKMEKSKDIASTAGLFITLVLALFCTDFKPVLGVSADFVKGGVFVGTVVVACFFVRVVINKFRYKVTVTDIVNRIKGNESPSKPWYRKFI